MLNATDPLPRRPRRILIAGVSGVGKTSLARRIATSLNVEHTELDALFHGPNWEPRASFLQDVDALIAQETWVTEWQYDSARPRLAQRADLMVWLDLPFLSVTLPRVVRRTIRRRVRREELWNGNVEGPLLTIFKDPEHIVRWAWVTRNKYRESVPKVAAEHPQLTVVRLRSKHEIEPWLGRLSG